MARSVTDRPRPAAGADAGRSAFAAEQSACCAQQDAFAAQQDAAFSDRGSGRARASAARTTASHPRARAQASRSAGEWQQQLVKHCSAVAQPHGLFMQGKGRERSLAASSRAVPESVRPGSGSDGRLPNGRGSPDATSA